MFIIDQSRNTLQLKYCAEPITALFTITGLRPKDLTLFQINDQKSFNFNQKNILKHIYNVCLHTLPQRYSRKPF